MHCAKREYFEHGVTHIGAVHMYWTQGAGLNVFVCGYLTQQSVMLEFYQVAYLQIFGRVRTDTFVIDCIVFSNNARDVSGFAACFLEQSMIFDGC
jgi:hypothetical protein